MAAFFRRRFGASAAALIAQPLLGGIHAGDTDRLSLPALFPRLADAERSGQKVLRWVQRTAGAGDGGSPFRSLASGMSELVEGIRRRLPDGAVRCGSPVTSLVRQDDEWQLTTRHGTATFGAVILACPAHVARDLLATVDARASGICGAVRYVSTVSLALGWPRGAIRHPLSGSGFVVARTSSSERITACTWASSKWDGRAPAGHALLRAYVGGAHDPAAVDLADDELVEMAVRELSAILSISGPPSVVRVDRWRNAGAQHEVGHQERIGELEARLAGYPGLFVTGSGFRSIGIPDCVADARAVAGKAGTASRMKRNIVGILVALAAASVVLVQAQSADHARLLKEIKQRDKGQLAVSEEDGRFLRLMIASGGAKRALEIGGASGYSAIWMGLALRETGGKLVSIEYDAVRAKELAVNIRRAGLADTVQVVTGDAFEQIPKLPGTFDFVFLDAWKRDYKRFFELVYPRLDKGGLFIAHNVVNKRDEMGDFLDVVQKHPSLWTTIVSPSGEGMSVSLRR